MKTQHQYIIYELLFFIIINIKVVFCSPPQPLPNIHTTVFDDKLEDHKITIEQATNNVKELVARSNDKDSCNNAKCTFQERLYCESQAVFNDHCCCDKLREPLSYAPHECWIPLPPREPCTPVAEDCAEYTRIMSCCCKQLLLKRYNSGNLPPWVSYMIGDAILTWFGFQKPSPSPVASPTSSNIQNDPLNDEGHKNLASNAKSVQISSNYLYVTLLLISCSLSRLV